jgi:hypothetical protein
MCVTETICISMRHKHCHNHNDVVRDRLQAAYRLCTSLGQLRAKGISRLCTTRRVCVSPRHHLAFGRPKFPLSVSTHRQAFETPLHVETHAQAKQQIQGGRGSANEERASEWGGRKV